MKKYLIIILLVVISGCNNKSDGISIDTIQHDTIVARLISKSINSNQPLVVVVPGSGGSFIPDKKLFGLVTSGYDVMSIAYFGKKNLPKKMELVPSRIFKRGCCMVKK